MMHHWALSAVSPPQKRGEERDRRTCSRCGATRVRYRNGRYLYFGPGRNDPVTKRAGSCPTGGSAR